MSCRSFHRSRSERGKALFGLCRNKCRSTRQFFFIGYKGKGERLIFSAPRLNAIIYILLSDISQTAPKALIVCFAPSASVYLITVFSPYVTSKSPV